MNRLLLKIIALLLFVFVSACYAELDTVAVTFEEGQESVSPQSLYCSGSRECLPVVDVLHVPEEASAPGAIISWDVSPFNDHQFTLTCKGIAVYSTLITGSGDMFFSPL